MAAQGRGSRRSRPGFEPSRGRGAGKEGEEDRQTDQVSRRQQSLQRRRPPAVPAPKGARSLPAAGPGGTRQPRGSSRPPARPPPTRSRRPGPARPAPPAPLSAGFLHRRRRPPGSRPGSPAAHLSPPAPQLRLPTTGAVSLHADPRFRLQGSAAPTNTEHGGGERGGGEAA